MFKSDPGLVPIPNRPDFWILDRPLVWTQAGLVITIPLGFITDDASIPKFLDWVGFLDRQGLSRRPGLLHDGLYAIGRLRGKDWADSVLREACRSEGMNAFQSTCIYQGVHLFGNSSWNADARYTGADANPGDFVDADTFKMLTGTAGDPYRAWIDAGASVFSVVP
jgi:hypothetical protein